MAAIPATGTRGQFPGIGAGGQPRRRNPVNAPRTWRGTRLQASNASVVQLVGVGTTDTNATGTLVAPLPQVGVGTTDTNATGTLALLVTPLLQRVLIPGIASGQPRRRNPVNVPRTFRGTRLPASNLSVETLVALGKTDTNATGTLTVIYPPALLPDALIPGIASGMPRRRNPMNVPRTFRGTRVFTTPAIVTSEALAGVGTTDTNATAVLFVVNLSLEAVGLTGSAGIATVSLSGLVAAGSTGSVGTGALGLGIPEVGVALTGSVGVASLAVGITEAFQGRAATATQAIGTLSDAVPLGGLATTDTVGIAALAVFGLVALSGVSSTGTVGRATLGAPVPLGAFAAAGSSAGSSLTVSVPLVGVGVGYDVDVALLGVANALNGVGVTGSVASGLLLSPVALRGLGTASSIGLSTLIATASAAGAIAIVLTDQVAYVVIEMGDA